MNTRGQLTAKAAKSIDDNIKTKGYDVYYDHGDSSSPFVGTIPVSTENELSSKNQISQLDIVVVEKDTHKAVALIEIEETTDTPKALIGDVFATLMGNSIHLPNRKVKADVGNWTSLIVITKGEGHDERKRHIGELANNAKSAIGTELSKTGKIAIAAFSESKPLEKVLMEQIEIVLRPSGGAFKGEL